MKEENKINTVNYTDWFLLYIDGELNEAAKQQVDRFLQQHPLLLQEFKLLQQTVSGPNDITAFDKNKLYKTEAINDEDILLFLDGELKGEKAITIETGNDAILNEKVTAFRNTVLTPDVAVIFPNKQKLIRHETKLRSMAGWLRVAAALLLMVSGFWMYYLLKPASSLIEIANVEKGVTAAVSNANTIAADTIKPNDTATPARSTKAIENAAARTQHDSEKQMASEQKTAVAKVNVDNVSVESAPARVNKPEVVSKTVAVTTEPLNVPQKLEPVTQQTALTALAEQQKGEAMVAKTETKKRNTFFKNISKKLEEKARNILTDDGETVSIAGLSIAIN